MFIKYTTLLLITVTPFLTIKTWDDFKDYEEQKFIFEADNLGIEDVWDYPPYKCKSIREFIISLKEFDQYYSAFQLEKQKTQSVESSIKKTFNTFWEYLSSYDRDFKNYQALLDKKNAFELLIIKLKVFGDITINSGEEFERVPTTKEDMFIKNNHDLQHIDENNIITDHEHNIENIDFYKLGKELNKLMFVQNKEDDYKNFVCYSVPEISSLIFEIVYLRFIKDKDELKLFLTGFLENFFDTDNNIDKAIFYRLFKSFYAYHLQVILNLDDDIIFKTFQLFRKLKNKDSRDFIIKDFINLYDLLKESIYIFHMNVEEKTEINNVFTEDLQILFIESSMFSLVYGISLVKNPIFSQMAFVGAYYAKMKWSQLEGKIVGTMRQFFHHCKKKYIDTIRDEIKGIEGNNENGSMRKQKSIKEIYDDFHDNLETFNNSAFFQSNFKLNDYFYEYTDAELVEIERKEAEAIIKENKFI